METTPSFLEIPQENSALDRPVTKFGGNNKIFALGSFILFFG
jgi:hypothetical protein